MDLVISTALLPERPAHILITKEMVEAMNPGSVIMDLAAANGGNCERTKQNEIINYNGITIDGTADLARTMPLHASSLYSKNLNNLFSYIYKESKDYNKEDEIINGSMLFNKGEVNNEPINTISEDISKVSRRTIVMFLLFKINKI